MVMVEDTRLHSEIDSEKPHEEGHKEENEITTLTMVDPGENVRQIGSDIREGDVVLDEGDVIGNTGGDVGALAFVGRRIVSLSHLLYVCH